MVTSNSRRFRVGRAATALVATTLTAATATAMATATAVAAGPSRAVVPGRNGLIAVVRSGTGIGNDIYTVRPDGSHLRRLTWNHGSFNPSWSPTGKRILYARSAEASTQIWLMGAAGRHKSRVFVGPGSNFQPSWAPDGRRFVFTSDRTGEDELYVFDFATRHVAQITAAVDENGPFASTAQWSPNGGRIVYDQAVWEPGDPYFPHESVYVVRPDGTGRRQINTDYTSGLSWAPGGRYLVWSQERIGSREPSTHDRLIVARADGTAVSQIPIIGDVNPTWSPDRRWIATARPVTGTQQFQNPPKPGVWLVHPNGSSAHRIYAAPHSVSVWDVDWQPIPG